MEILFKTGKKLNLDWNPLVLEYLEDYDGGLEQLKNDLESKEIPFRVFNFIIYCFISAVYPEEIGYREAISLVEPNDYEKIVNFAIEKINNFSSLGKEEIKNQNKTVKKQHRR